MEKELNLSQRSLTTDLLTGLDGNDGNNSLDIKTDLGLHSELDIKFEPEDNMNDSSTDNDDDGVGYNGSASTDQHNLKMEEICEEPDKVASSTSTDQHNLNMEEICEEPDKVASNVLFNSKLKNNQANVNLDINNASSINSAKKYSCSLCKYTTCKEHQIKNHLQAHSALKTYICDICSYVTTVKCNLVKHIRTHTGQKPYSCEICRKNFSQSSHVKVHIKKHIGVCEICSGEFSQSDQVKICNGEKPYPFVCEVCEEQSKQSSNVKRYGKTYRRKVSM